MSRIELPNAWGICACANEPALRLLRDILRTMSEPVRDGHDWVTKHISRRESVAGGRAQWELFMHYIERMGWSDHGGGINSSWLNSEGLKALAVLERLPLDE